MSSQTKTPSNRTLATRTKIIATAEVLFAERGVESVSLNEITRAAGQKNRNAVHYHFGSKQALLHAIFEKHQQPIAALRCAMLDDISNSPQTGPEQIAAALVRPVAERFNDPDGGVAYIRISSQLAATNTLSYFHTGAAQGASTQSWPELNRLWMDFLPALPPAVHEQRISLVVGMMFHGLADHALFREQAEPGLGNTELTVCNLIDSICAVLTAPVSDATTRAISAPTGKGASGK